MGSAERRERERQLLRKKILDAARELILSEGLESLTLRKIAERIEYSPTAIYLHFRDKEDLVRELCKNDFLSLADEFIEIAKEKDVVERLRLAGRAYAGFALKHPDQYRLMFMTPPISSPPEGEPWMGNPEYDAYAFCLALCQEALDAGRLRPELKDPELMAQVLWAGIHGVVSLEIARGRDPWVKWRPAKKRLELMMNALIAGFVAPGEGLSVVDLALKTLLHDKLRFAITVLGVAFSVTLILVQSGLFLGLLSYSTVTIDNPDADLWITSRNTPNVDFPHTFPEAYVERVRGVPGVARADNLIVAYLQIALPSGAQEGVLVYALEDFRPWRLPWNVVEGDLTDLRRGRFLFLDDSATKRLGEFHVGERREILGTRLEIAGRTREARSFTTTPIAFLDYRLAQDLNPNMLRSQTTYTLVQLEPGADVERVRRAIQERLPFNDVFTKAEWASRSRSYWIVATGLGLNMFLTVFLGCLVGTVVVAQTLYTSTMEHLREFGTVKAIGGSNADIYRILARQAVVSALAGYAVGLLPALAASSLVERAGLFHRLSREHDRALLIVTHDPAVRAIADRVLKIRDGLIAA